jgi:quercetin dioxygenase-like cupin family protein
MSFVLLLYLAFSSSLLGMRLRGRHALFPPRGEQKERKKRAAERHLKRSVAPAGTLRQKPNAPATGDRRAVQRAGYRLSMAGQPSVVWMPGAVRTEIHLASADTGGAFCLLIDEPPAGWSLPAHRHSGEAETIHVLEGAFEIEVDGTRSQLGAGDTIHIPQGAVHSGSNVGAQTGRRLILFSPAGLERFFLEAGSPTPEEEIDPAAALACATRHGWEFTRA